MMPIDIQTLQTADIELPPEISRLQELAYDLWWSWAPQASRLFAWIDPEHWRRYHNPVQVLINVEPRQWERLLGDPEFRRHYDLVMREYDDYRSTPRWFERSGLSLPGPVAYLSTEFGVHESLGVYSGGLGILSGDHCKAASDLGVPLVAVGLLYRSGYFRQTVDPEGFQQHIYPDFDFARLPILPVQAPGGGALTIPVDLPGRIVQVRVWKAQVGSVPILLLDTDIPLNDPADRPITSILYVRGREMRVCQEVVLGVGGVRALRALGIYPAVWHMNEGHVALLGYERARERVLEGDSFADALEGIRRTCVFTTHTPVPAGNETFERKLVHKYLEAIIRDVGCEPEEALSLGRDNGNFNMTVLAIRVSSAVNGVSQLHGKVSSEMWRHLWPEAPERPVSAITNGVHTESWIGPEMRAFYTQHMGTDWSDHLFDSEYWKRIQAVPDGALWAAHRQQKERLVRFAREHVRQQSARHGLSPDELRAIEGLLDPHALTIGFARRFATYKRAVLVLSDLDRLRAILSNEGRPVQFLFAGKAHPADREGQESIRRLMQLTQGDLRGKVVFLENYDIEIGRMLVQGCDVWLNTPRRPLEASGTSGMKVPINGGINVSILDGWWCEGYRGDNGWAIGDDSANPDNSAQDAADAASLYNLLEEEIAPRFFDRDEHSLPRHWIATMKSSIESVVAPFSAHRMVRDYVEQMYIPASNRR